MVRVSVIIFIFLLLPHLSAASTHRVIRSAFSFIYEKPNTLSRILYIFREGDKVTVISQARGWTKVKVNNRHGYLHITGLSTRLLPVNENIYNILIKKLKGDTISSVKKGFSEEDELSAASKGFSEEDELSAASKGFSEEDELSAASKGFSEEDELSAASKGFSEEDELSAASKGFSEEDELSAASKGFSKKGVVKTKGSKGKVSVILKKYSFFNKKEYIRGQLAILKVLRKYKGYKTK